MSSTILAEAFAPAVADVIDRLPPEAADKLQRLRDAREQAATLTRAESTQVYEARQEWRRAGSHLEDLERAYASGSLTTTTHIREPKYPDMAETGLEEYRERVVIERTEVAPDEKRLATARAKVSRLKAALARREAALTKHKEIMDTVGALLTSCEEYLRRLPRGAAIELDDGGAVKPPKADLSAAIEQVREQLRAIGEEILDVASAPRPSAELKSALAQRVTALARRGRPSLRHFMTDGKTIGFPSARALDLSSISATGDVGVVTGSIDDALGVLVWLCEDALVERLSRMIDDSAEDDVALSVEDRAARLADLKARLLEVERIEVAYLEMMTQSGAEKLPRAATDPRAYLCLSGDLPEPKS